MIWLIAQFIVGMALLWWSACAGLNMLEDELRKRKGDK